MTVETLKGIVIPIVWSADGTIVAVAVSTNSEDEYRVEDEGCGSELLHHIQSEVEVKGVVFSERDEKRIKIKEYKICRTWE